MLDQLLDRCFFTDGLDTLDGWLIDASSLDAWFMSWLITCLDRFMTCLLHYSFSYLNVTCIFFWQGRFGGRAAGNGSSGSGVRRIGDGGGGRAARAAGGGRHVPL